MYLVCTYVPDELVGKIRIVNINQDKTSVSTRYPPAIHSLITY